MPRHEAENSPELQREGCQAILDNFGRYVEARGWARRLVW